MRTKMKIKIGDKVRVNKYIDIKLKSTKRELDIKPGLISEMSGLCGQAALVGKVISNDDGSIKYIKFINKDYLWLPKWVDKI